MYIVVCQVSLGLPLPRAICTLCRSINDTSHFTMALIPTKDDHVSEQGTSGSSWGSSGISWPAAQAAAPAPAPAPAPKTTVAATVPAVTAVITLPSYTLQSFDTAAQAQVYQFCAYSFWLAVTAVITLPSYTLQSCGIAALRDHPSCACMSSIRYSVLSLLLRLRYIALLSVVQGHLLRSSYFCVLALSAHCHLLESSMAGTGHSHKHIHTIRICRHMLKLLQQGLGNTVFARCLRCWQSAM